MTDTAALSADDVVTALLEAMDHDFWDDRLFSDAFDLEKLARVIDRLRASPAPDRVSDAMVKAAAYEFLLHRGERPGRVTRNGAELWEENAAAMRAAIEAALSEASK